MACAPADRRVLRSTVTMSEKLEQQRQFRSSRARTAADLLRSDDLAPGATECVFLDCDVLLQRRRACVAVNRHDSSRLPLDLQTITSYGDQNHPNETQDPSQGNRIVWVYSNRTQLSPVGPRV